MSYDDYVNHIFQKYRLALSISVIKTKPENITLEQYIQLLRSKFGEERTNLDDFSVSICSDDFHIDELLVNIDENDFNIDETGQLHMNIDENDFSDQIGQPNDEHTQNEINYAAVDTLHKTDLSININQCNDKNQSNEALCTKTDDIFDQIDIEMINTQDSNESIMILHNFDKETADLNNINTETDQRKSLDDVIDILKSIDGNMTTIEKGISNKELTHSENFKALGSEHTVTDKYSRDNDGTLCESLEILSNAEKYRLSKEHSNHLTNNQSSNHKDRRTGSNVQMIEVHNTKSTVDCKETTRNQKIYQFISDKTKLDTSTNKMETKSNFNLPQKEFSLESNSKLLEHKQQSKIRDYRHTKELKNIYQNVANIFDITNSKKAHQDTKVHNSNNVVMLNKSQQIPPETQDVVMYTTLNDFQCNTHYSESQVNDLIVIDGKFIHGTNKNSNKQQNKDVDQITVFNKNMHINNDVFSQEQTNFSALSINSNRNHEANSSTSELKNDRDCENCSLRKPTQVDNDMFSQDSQIPNCLNSSKSHSQICDSIIHIKKSVEMYKDLQDNKECQKDNKNEKGRVQYIDTDLFSQESQITNFSFPTNNKQSLTENSLELLQDAQKVDEYLDQFRIPKSQESLVNDRTKDLPYKGCTAFDKNMVLNDQTDSSVNFDENSENLHVAKEIRSIEHDENSEVMQVKNHKSCDNFDNNLDNTQITEGTEPCTKLNENFNSMQLTETCNVFDDNLEGIEMEEELTDSQIELIPFKVIEELNKIKTYLNITNEKKLSFERCSGDTGYRSDSQSKHSFKMSQSSSVWLDQSAHSIFLYILECPLMVTTQDITNEIAVVLGQLIDKLHNEEKYPSFLENLLESVQLLIGLVYGDNSDEDMLMKKDETIQRILLLNKSIHIQKYTIEKITFILETLHTELTTNNSMYEMKNINQIENICYVFHILEIILQKYNKVSLNLSQCNLQSNSQEEDKVLKKSNIMDIWRKKWNPNYKESQNEGSSEKTCILSGCNAILNKLVVDCMDGYSLISYFALKCFNVMQT